MKKLIFASIIAIGVIIPTPAIASPKCPLSTDTLIKSTENVSICKSAYTHGNTMVTYRMVFNERQEINFLHRLGTKYHGVYFTGFDSDTELFIKNKMLINSKNYNAKLVDTFRESIKMTIDYIEKENPIRRDF